MFFFVFGFCVRFLYLLWDAAVLTCKVASFLCFLCFLLGHCSASSSPCEYHTSSYIFWVLFIICSSVFHSRSTKRWTRNRVWTPSSGLGQAATLPPPSVMSVLIYINTNIFLCILMPLGHPHGGPQRPGCLLLRSRQWTRSSWKSGVAGQKGASLPLEIKIKTQNNQSFQVNSDNNDNNERWKCSTVRE